MALGLEGLVFTIPTSIEFPPEFEGLFFTIPTSIEFPPEFEGLFFTRAPTDFVFTGGTNFNTAISETGFNEGFN